MSTLRALAGEGRYHSYNLLATRRGFLSAKILRTTLFYYKGTSGPASAGTAILVNGENQARYYRHAIDWIEAEFGPVQLYRVSDLADPSTHQSARLLPRFTVQEVLVQVMYILLMLMTGNRRYLNLYFLYFADAIDRVVSVGLRDVRTFICFNDQPYDAAAIVHSLNRASGARTIVIQHGLVLSEDFYFPTIAKEFWAWGELSRAHYRSRTPSSAIVIKGRYPSDARDKQTDLHKLAPGRSARLLIAPSYFHDEVKEILAALTPALSQIDAQCHSLSIKYHPATKLVGSLQTWQKAHTPQLRIERAPMELLSSNYDALITKNSTSAVDFLLKGKPVFFLNPRADGAFPSSKYGFSIDQLPAWLSGEDVGFRSKNEARLNFLRLALNV